MKIPKSILQAVAVALAVTTVTACAVTEIGPKDKERKAKEEPYNCPLDAEWVDLKVHDQNLLINSL